DKIYVRLGVAGVIFEPDATFRVQDQKLPGAQIGLSSNVTLSGEAGYYVSLSISFSMTGGVPPKTHATGEGSIASQGLLGSVRYGTIVALADYHFNKTGRLQPWFGAGPAFLLVLSNNGAAIQNLRVSNRWGAALQVGTSYMLSAHWGLFASATQSFVGSEGRGDLGPYSVDTKFALNPVALQSGVELRF
ncbi:MAG: OmpW/AlkL family protein, partial [Janthinobacterium lividum]